MKQQKILKNERAITLIALVITIIVLLILAGVTIAMLSGNNSAPQKATEAAQKDAIAAAKDEIAMEAQEALLNYYNNTYVVGTGTLKANTQENVENAADRALNNVKSRNSNILDSSNVDTDEHEIIIYTKSYKATGEIKQNGAIIWGEISENTDSGDTLSVSKLKKMIGNEVTYSGYQASYNRGWSLFYADNDYAYIITNTTLNSSDSFGGNSGIPISKYTGSTDAETATKVQAAMENRQDSRKEAYGEKWNKMWLTKPGAVKSQARHQAVAYLCDKDNWTRFVAPKAPDGTYAVGGPTLELFLAAWNLRDGAENEVSVNQNDLTIYGYPYTITSGIAGSVFTTGNTYWLASPMYADNSNYTTHVLYLPNYSNGISSEYNSYWEYGRGARPIVVIPRKKIQLSQDKTKLEVIMKTTED